MHVCGEEWVEANILIDDNSKIKPFLLFTHNSLYNQLLMPTIKTMHPFLLSEPSKTDTRYSLPPMSNLNSKMVPSFSPIHKEGYELCFILR